jgi:DNA-binding transcriptional ArsR family regulator
MSNLSITTGLETAQRGGFTMAKVTAAGQDAAGRADRKRRAARAAVLLKQAADATRVQVLLMLTGGERHVGAICDEVGQSQPAVSHHLALLRHGYLIAPRREGKNNFYGLTPEGERLAAAVKEIVG